MTMRVTCWGVRGSHPVPGPSTGHFGGNTPCILVEAAGQSVILDAGSGIVALGRALMGQRAPEVPPLILFSHLHRDHLEGLPFFAPLFSPEREVRLVVPAFYGQPPEALLAAAMGDPYFPLPFHELCARRPTFTLAPHETLTLDGATVSVGARRDGAGALHVQALRSYAHPGGVLCYRIEAAGCTLVYATDVEGYEGGDQRLVAFASGADLLIHDAQYSAAHYLGRAAGRPCTQGWGHATPAMAARVAQAAGVGQLLLFHHDPTYDDAAIRAQAHAARALFARSAAAREGQCITLAARTAARPSPSPLRHAPA